METTRLVLYVISCAITLVAIGIAILLAPRPCSAACHVRGLGRLLVLAGAALGLPQAAVKGWYPVWPVVLYIIGIGILSALYTWDALMKAVEKERKQDDEVAQSSGT